tara:strand:- start:6385 stop:7491 length:1107 start_codon:yes stop_codon:yes gene_type:complete
MKILVGFVNKFFAPNLNLAIFDTNDESFNWIYNKEIDSVVGEVKGVNGVVEFRDHYIVGYQSKPTKIAVFDRNFKIISVNAVKEIVNLHTFTTRDHKLYTVSTGTDEVFEVDFDENWNIKSTKCIYKKSIYKKDKWHINSICNHEGNLIVTCFNKKINGSWKNSKVGQIIDISNNIVLKKNLFQPHTAYSSESNQLLFCESGANNLHLGLDNVLKTQGYTRAITEDNDFYYVGLSGRRLQSRSKGLMNTEETTNNEESKSGIVIINKNTLEIVNVHYLNNYGIEIFDIIILNYAPEWVKNNIVNQLQMEEFENQIYALKTKLISIVKKKNIFTRIFLKSKQILRQVYLFFSYVFFDKIKISESEKSTL